ncbi:MAG: polyprenyl synthetase family protein [Pseudomonadota bacterium]
MIGKPVENIRAGRRDREWRSCASAKKGKGSAISTFAKDLKRNTLGSDTHASIDAIRAEIDTRLEQLLPARTQEPENLHRAMCFGALATGKRVRPLLAVLISEAAGGHGRSFALDAGCAIECVHTASLILDDLPCMDDAQLRRGQPTTHRKFGEATAIIAAIGLLNRAYGIIAADQSADPQTRNTVLSVLSDAIGSNGMIAGQELDISRLQGRQPAAAAENVNWMKTGVLFVATAHIGGLAAGLNMKTINALKEFAKCVGLAFQTADDILDMTGSEHALGKDVGKDIGRPTLVAIAGEEAARRTCETYLEDADRALLASGLETSGLRALVDTIFGSK